MVQEAFEEQTELGWGQALRGRLSMKWSTAMVMYYQEVDEHRREAVPMGEKWMVNTIKALWEHSCSLWTSRNEFVHGKDEKSKREKQRNNWKRLWIRHSNTTKTMSQPTLGPYSQRERTMSRNNESRRYSTGSKQYDWQQTQGEKSPKQSNHSYAGA
jgi:hypothetical protein